MEKKKKCSCCKHKVTSHWLWELSKCYLLSFALLICKCAKSTGLSIKIKTTLAKEEIGQILSYVCKHAEEKYTNGSSMILHYGPLQVLKIIQGAISSKVENLPRIPSHTPFLSGEFRSKIVSIERVERSFWNDFHFLNLIQLLSKHWEFNISHSSFKDGILPSKKHHHDSKDMSCLWFGSRNCPVNSLFCSKYVSSFSPKEWEYSKVSFSPKYSHTYAYIINASSFYYGNNFN